MFDDTSPLINQPHKSRPAPILALNFDHDQHPISYHGGHVPGTRRISRQAREARAILTALAQRIAEREEDEALDGWLPGIDDAPDHVRDGWR